MNQNEKSLSDRAKRIKKILEEKTKWLDNADLKIMFDVSDSTLYRWRVKKIIPSNKIGRKVIFPTEYFTETLIAKCLNS